MTWGPRGYLQSVNFALKIMCQQKFSEFLKTLTPERRSLSLHAEKVSYMYQSENKHENYENHLIHGFVNLSIGKQNMKTFEEYHFLTQKVERLRPKSLFRKNMIISFCIIFKKKSVACNEAQKIRQIQGKTKKLTKSRRVMQFREHILKL